MASDFAVHCGDFRNRGDLGPVVKKMAGKTGPQCTLLQITSEWYLDYCICQLWKEFKAKRSLSACWRDAIQGKAMGTTQYGVSNASCSSLLLYS